MNENGSSMSEEIDDETNEMSSDILEMKSGAVEVALLRFSNGMRHQCGI
jgi:hypothetical protein